MSDPLPKRDTALFVPESFVMRPNIHDILPHGGHLADGMVVLIENPNMRAIPTREDVAGAAFFEMMRDARWCTVSQVSFVDSGTVSFVGVYGDGTKMTRTVSINLSWIVDRASRIMALRKDDPFPKKMSGLKEFAVSFKDDYTYGQHIEGGQDYTPEMMQTEADAENALNKYSPLDEIASMATLRYSPDSDEDMPIRLFHEGLATGKYLKKDVPQDLRDYLGMYDLTLGRSPAKTRRELRNIINTKLATWMTEEAEKRGYSPNLDKLQPTDLEQNVKTDEGDLTTDAGVDYFQKQPEPVKYYENGTTEENPTPQGKITERVGTPDDGSLEKRHQVAKKMDMENRFPRDYERMVNDVYDKVIEEKYAGDHGIPDEDHFK